MAQPPLRSETDAATVRRMQSTLSYRHRVITESDLVFIRRLIAEHPGSSRWGLSKKLCEAWNWVQANGALRDMVCRGLMLMLHRAGPDRVAAGAPRRRATRWSSAARRSLVDVDQAPLQTSLAELGPLEVRQVRRTPEEAMFNSLLQQHHYLGYAQPVGEHLKYVVYAQALGRSPAWRGVRRRAIWAAATASSAGHRQARLANIRLLAYNTRFLILPWVTVPHLASHLLGRMARGLSADWQASVRAPDLLRRDLRRSAALSRHLLPRGQLDPSGRDHRPRQGRPHRRAQPLDQERAGLSAGQGLPPATVVLDSPVRPAA